MYHVYQIQAAAAAYLFLYVFIVLSFQFSNIKVQMTKIYISVSSLQFKQHYFKDHTAENRMQKFHLVPEI